MLPLAVLVFNYPLWVIVNRRQGSAIPNEKFSEDLKENSVTAWIHGHYHTNPHKKYTRVDRWKTTFINDSAILEGHSLLLIFKNGQKKVTVKSRNHHQQKWNHLEEKFSFDLDYPFTYHQDELRVWVWSDSQPSRPSDWKNFEAAAADTQQNINPDIALVLGDIVNCGMPRFYRQYKKTIEKANFDPKNFYELAGNHEFCCGEGGRPIYKEGDPYCGYQKNIKNNLHYSHRKGNVLFLFLSHEGSLHGNIITEQAFQWWKNAVRDNSQSSNIITLSHQPLRGTTRGTKFDPITFINVLPSQIKIMLPNL